MKAIRFESGWMNQVEPGRPFRMTKGVALKDQLSRRRLREAGELFTPDEVAAKLKIKNGRDTILGWIHHGDARGRKLGFYKIGRHYRISEAHLEEFLA